MLGLEGSYRRVEILPLLGTRHFEERVQCRVHLGKPVQFRAIGNLKGKGEQQQEKEEDQNVQHHVSRTNGLNHRLRTRGETR